MLTVIADDITGAAEIAGIAFSNGLKVTMIIAPTVRDTSLWDDHLADDIDVLVVATDARSYGAEKASELTACAIPPFCGRIFRKTDSALRGNVVAELETIIANTNYESVIYMPANPSKGRIIRDGIYYIQAPSGPHVPIAETDFRFDPEFPAYTSDVHERFPDMRIPDAESKGDIENIVDEALKNGWLLAGAADLFQALIEKTFTLNPRNTMSHLPLDAESLIVACGSTQSKGIPIKLITSEMPIDVFNEKTSVSSWTDKAKQDYEQDHKLLLTIGNKPVRKEKGAAVYLRSAMADVTTDLINDFAPQELIIEGGATAFAIISKLPWRTFEITNQIAPGVVRMKAIGANTYITMKPGSYRWSK